MEADVMTFHGLQSWYDKEFENAGWVILANGHGHHFKVLAYRHSIMHLIHALRLKIDDLKGLEGQAGVSYAKEVKELAIMIENAEYLKHFVDQGLAVAIRSAIAKFKNEIETGHVQEQAPLSPVIQRLSQRLVSQ